ncbi:response regulator transcription factor [Nostoc ellipsosporum NOK]|jgi:two-component system invasion response regulator UvrY|nr:response regulator transcription factor [Nostoc ellipsosporum NOK]
MNPLTILIAEDHAIVRLGTAMLVREIYPQAQISEAHHLKSALQQLAQQSFRLLILDINIPGGDNTDMIRSIRLRQPDVPILILSSYDEVIYAPRYLKAGANGYLHKEADAEDIKRAIHKVIHGDTYASEAVQQQLLRLLSNMRTDNGFNDLSDREIEIMHLLARGFSPTDIKRRLNIQLSTISTHKANIFEKLQVSNVVQLAEKLKELERRKEL